MIWLDQYNITDSKIHYNTDPKDLYKITISKGQGILTSDGTLSVNTGKFTGRSPRDRYIVKDEKTKNKVWWGDINRPFNEVQFSKIEDKLSKYLSGKNLYVRDCSACASQKSEIKIRTICELPWSDLFIHNMFLRNSLEGKEVDWTIICAPNFIADSEELGTDNSNFSIINFSKKKILIGGTAYTGEIKKGIFSVLNFLLPVNENTLPMHCSANTSDKGETSIFFGLSGTGKTTLSTDKNRKLIGDDEHGWDNNNTIFNFEGGCYAKVLDLSEDKEPDIFNAIRPCALLENIVLDRNGVVDYNDSSITQNSRVSYPIHHIKNSVKPSIGSKPKNIFFLPDWLSQWLQINFNISVDTTPLEIVQQSVFLGLIGFFFLVEFRMKLYWFLTINPYTRPWIYLISLTDWIQDFMTGLSPVMLGVDLTAPIILGLTGKLADSLNHLVFTMPFLPSEGQPGKMMIDNEVQDVLLFRYLPSLWYTHPIPNPLREFWYTAVSYTHLTLPTILLV